VLQRRARVDQVFQIRRLAPISEVCQVRDKGGIREELLRCEVVQVERVGEGLYELNVVVVSILRQRNGLGLRRDKRETWRMRRDIGTSRHIPRAQPQSARTRLVLARYRLGGLVGVATSRRVGDNGCRFVMLLEWDVLRGVGYSAECCRGTGIFGRMRLLQPHPQQDVVAQVNLAKLGA
jgi:hypothetical protein